MFYDIALNMALAIFGFGLIYKIVGWLRLGMGVSAPGRAPAARVRAAVQGLAGVVFGPKIKSLSRAFIVDVLLQNRILKEDRLRWLMHMLIFAGFSFLFFTHALDRIIPTPLFDRFYLTLNPYLLISGLMVLAGVAVALYRRLALRVPRLKSSAADYYALAILLIVIVSGIVMECMKLTSYNHYEKLWYVHILAVLSGLAYLPFSKLFHVLTTPLSLLANAVMDETSAPANIKTRQVMELDACTRCHTCSYRCSVAVAYDSLGNAMILPSERMAFLKDFIAHKRIGPRGLAAIQQGIYLCTNCDRCTVVCPAGINLRELWFSVREELVQRGDGVALMLTPFSFYRGLRRQELDPEQYNQPLLSAQKAVGDRFKLLKQTEAVIPLSPANSAFKKTVGFSERAGTYAYCFACENCSTVCPVVGNYENPEQALDLLPHQIMRSMGLGLRDFAMGSSMLWDCLTCYQCQEHCPQGVKVTDILYELKNACVKEASRPAVGQPVG